MSLLEHLFSAQLTLFGQQILWREIIGNAFGFASAMSPAPQQVAAGIGSSSMSSIGARCFVVLSSSFELNSAMQPG